MSNQNPTPTTPDSLPPNCVAFIIDGVVQDIIYCQDRFAAILTSNPKIIQVTGEKSAVMVGYEYDESTNSIVNPEDRNVVWQGTK
jgi:hypothetical protein